jgi:hypothetical protein
MAFVETPHFAAPFSISKSGAAVVEQNEPEEIEACVYNIVQCPLGFREDLPKFGVPEMEFQNAPLDVSGVQYEITKWEPRAEDEIIERVLNNNEQERKLSVRIFNPQTEG